VLLAGFARLCDSFAEIAAKELAGTPRTQAEAELVSRCGRELTRYCLYWDGANRNPRDEPTRGSRRSPFANEPHARERLWVGTALSRAAVLVVDGVLHQGGVLAFREQRSARAWTDEAWRAALRSAAPPPAPELCKSYRRP
jgi:hypothetical protein